ncbi:MAG TPA: glycosyltransferase [Lacibacter sp.]|nr:glycosyltransferase [Lacibacter sp.]HMO88373.1 glycosyltransferase [Lacibacter sp.]
MLWLLVTLLLLLPYSLLLLLYRRWWKAVPATRVPASFEPSTRFTVIIPARNEAENLPLCLASVGRLQYPAHLLEVVLVDDYSDDTTAAIAASFPGVRVIRLGELLEGPINSYKKKAIETGVATAAGDYIVTTDADCTVPPGWLRYFAWIIEQAPTVFIAAPVAMDREDRFIRLFQSLDFLSLQGITGASVGAGFHSMSNGANLCYSRAAFYEVGGFKDIDDLASGDDMLLLHKLYQKYPEQVRYCKAPGCIVHTRPVDDVRAFFLQRIRWASKAQRYHDRRIFWVLLLVYLVNLWLLVLLPAGLFQPWAWVVLAGALLFKTLAELWFLLPVAAFFGKRHLLPWFPLLQPHHILYTVLAGWLGQWGRYEWKGREVQ